VAGQAASSGRFKAWTPTLGVDTDKRRDHRQGAWSPTWGVDIDKERGHRQGARTPTRGADTDMGRGHRHGACCGKTHAAELRVRIFRMKRRELLFDETSINFIRNFYRFHDDNLGRSNFDRIIDQEYVPKLKQHKRGFSDMISAYDAAIADIEEELGRSSWSKIDGNKVYSVRPSFRRFEYRVQDLIVYENESCLINACEQQPRHLHVLLAKSKKSHLLTFKRFSRLINEILQKYEVITAHIAEKPCVLVGKENDWRFEKNADNESRLLRFWRSIGFESFQPNKCIVKIERKTP
jgi:hypothetical protein